MVGRACLSEIARANRFDLRQNKQRRRYVRPGQVLAIMGPSGSGKTTLLTILAARARPTSGQLRLNGAPYDAAAKALIALVPQDDALFPNLTVRGGRLPRLRFVSGGASFDRLDPRSRLTPPGLLCWRAVGTR